MRRDIIKVKEWLGKALKYSGDHIHEYNSAIYGFSIQGYTGELIDDLLMKGATEDQPVSGYIEGGYTKEAYARLDKLKSEDSSIYQKCLDKHCNT